MFLAFLLLTRNSDPGETRSMPDGTDRNACLDKPLTSSFCLPTDRTNMSVESRDSSHTHTHRLHPYSGNAHVIKAFNENFGVTSNNKWTLALSIFYVGYCKYLAVSDRTPVSFLTLLCRSSRDAGKRYALGCGSGAVTYETPFSQSSKGT